MTPTAAATLPVDWVTEIVAPTLRFLAEVQANNVVRIQLSMCDEERLLDRLEHEGWFHELEAVGKVRLPESLRIAISIAIRLYEDAGPEWRAYRHSQYQETARLCGHLALSMRPVVNALRALNFSNQSIPTSLRDMDWRAVRGALWSIERSLSDIAVSNKPDGRKREQDDRLIMDVADIFYRAGGHIALSSETGPWVRFLTKIWEVLPVDCRPENDSALVTRAMKPKIKRLLAERFPATSPTDAAGRAQNANRPVATVEEYCQLIERLEAERACPRQGRVSHRAH